MKAVDIFPERADRSGDEKTIVIYTDGACIGNPGPGGAGIVMISGRFRKELSCFLGNVTNNIAELMAIKLALENIKRRDFPVCLYTDSSYSIGVVTGIYKAHKNQELVRQIRRLLKEFKKVEIFKVSGHVGIVENERAHKLAFLAVKSRDDSIAESQF